MRRALFFIPAILALTACRGRQGTAAQDATPTVDDAATEDSHGAADALAPLLEALFDASTSAPDAKLAEVRITSVKVTQPGALTGVDALLAREKWRFRPCAAHATTERTIDLEVRVGEGGEVIAATSPDTSPFAACVTAAARRVPFGEPRDGHAAVAIRVVIVPP